MGKGASGGKLERLEGTEDKLDLGDLAKVKTPRRPGENVGKSHYEAADSKSHSQCLCARKKPLGTYPRILHLQNWMKDTAPLMNPADENVYSVCP